MYRPDPDNGNADNWFPLSGRLDIEIVATIYIAIDGTGVPVMPRETEGRKGKDETGKAKTREAKAMRHSLPTRDQLLMRVGAAKTQAGRAFGFVHIDVPDARQAVTRLSFQFRVDKDKLNAAQLRDDTTHDSRDCALTTIEGPNWTDCNQGLRGMETTFFAH